MTILTDAVASHHEQLLAAERAARRQARLEAMLKAVPKKFHDRRLRDYKPRNPSQVAALEATEAWITEVEGGRPAMIALVGPKGTGKSHLLYGAAWHLFEAGRIEVPSIFRWYLFGDDLKWGRGPRDEHGQPRERNYELRREWFAANPAFIDEVRHTSGTEADATELAKYAMNAYDEEISVFLTTNMARLDLVMGEPAADRFTVKELVGDSYRG